MVRKQRFKLATGLLIIMIFATGCLGNQAQEAVSGGATSVRLAVEYNTHAAPVFVAQEHGLLPRQESFDVFVTGVALSGALANGNVEAAYICLVPAINAYANGNVPIQIVCGTHKHGYGLVADTNKIKRVQDLAEQEVKIGCVREGGTVDVLLNKMIDEYGMDRQKVLDKVVRMNPAQLVMALTTGRVDAIWVPEHFATIAEQQEQFSMLVKSQDVWPELQGSVLIVTRDLAETKPEAVRQLREATQQACRLINRDPQSAAEIVANKLNAFEESLDIDLKEIGQGQDSFTSTSVLIQESMKNLDYTTDVKREDVQQVIDYLYELGYIKRDFPAEEIMATAF